MSKYHIMNFDFIIVPISDKLLGTRNDCRAPQKPVIWSTCWKCQMANTTEVSFLIDGLPSLQAKDRYICLFRFSFFFSVQQLLYLNRKVLNKMKRYSKKHICKDTTCLKHPPKSLQYNLSNYFGQTQNWTCVQYERVV